MKNNNPIEDLQEIRKLMEGSTKFLSLSGLSGIFAGLTALAGAAFVWIKIDHFNKMFMSYYVTGTANRAASNLLITLIITALVILVVAVSFGFLFTWLKAKRQKEKLATPLSFRLLGSLMLPLAFGGTFVLIEAYHGYYELIGPSTLIFYGLALLNAAKYVHIDIKYLAISEMLLGLLCFYNLDFSLDSWKQTLIYWSIGFGVLHIFYGTMMYFRYEYKKG